MSHSIAKNKKYFESCLNTAKALFDEELYDDCALYLQELSTFAWKNFTGYYASWKLESLLNLLGNKVTPLPLYSKKHPINKKLSILHIVSEVYKTGGHTKLLLNWIELDKDNKHSIVSTRMDEKLMLGDIVSFASESSNTIKSLNNTKLLSKAYELKQIAKEYDKIVLHIHPDDIIPIIAFSDKNFSIPVLFLNHADHIFWVGISVTDCLIQIREPNINIDRERRGAKFQKFLPIPINEDQKTFNEEKIKFDKKEDDVILLSTGSEYKYKPFQKHNFFEGIFKIVESFENVFFFIAGVSPENEYAKQYIHPRIVYLGEVTNLFEYEELCDIYVEGFPMSSFTALLQPAIKGKYIQLMYQPTDIFRLFDDNEEYNLVYPKSFKEWFEQLSIAINDADTRIKKAEKQYKYINRVYNLKNWGNLLNAIYDDTNNITHKTRKHKKDVFYVSDNEYILSVLNHGVKMCHYKYCSKLSFWECVKVILRVRYKTKEVFVGKKETWNFLIKSS